MRTEQGQNLIYSQHLAIRFECGQKSLVNVFCWDYCLTIAQSTSCAGVFGQYNVEAKVGSRPCRGIHTHMGHHSRDHQALNVQRLKMI